MTQGQQFQAILSDSSSFYSPAKIRGSQAGQIDYMRKKLSHQDAFI